MTLLTESIWSIVPTGNGHWVASGVHGCDASSGPPPLAQGVDPGKPDPSGAACMQGGGGGGAGKGIPYDEDCLYLSVHSTDPAIRRQLRGDLDAVLNKAMKKAAAERYPTVAAFADEIERYLNQQPVLAQPDRLLYRARKFATRHRRALTAA